jgi:hypothetical protein
MKGKKPVEKHRDKPRRRSISLSTDNVRQGETTGRMRRVLGYSLALSFVAGTLILLVPWIR